MNARFAGIVVATVGLCLGPAGCSDKKPEAPAEKSKDEPTGYVESLLGAKKFAERQMAKRPVQVAAQAVEMFRAAMGRLPSTGEGLQALVTRPSDPHEADKWIRGGGPFLDRIPEDPWGQPLRYERLAGRAGAAAFRVWSIGPDGQNGTNDDVVSASN